MAKRLRGHTEMMSFKLRMPEGLRGKLEAEAEKSGRSINSEILWRLGHTFGPEWQELIAVVEKREKEWEELQERIEESPEMKKIISDLMAGKFKEPKKPPTD